MKNPGDQGNELRKTAEAIFSAKASLMPENIKNLSPDDAQQLIYNLQVHQIELEIQNEELRRTQVELDTARARYFDLYDLAPVGYCTLSREGQILETNFTAANMLGLARGVMIKRMISRYILKNDQDIYYLHSKRLFDTGEPQEFELRLVRQDGTSFWAHLSASAVQDFSVNTDESEEAVFLYRVVMSDISEVKLASEKIKNLLHEKEIILREVHHRIKNNMNTISSLLALQAEISKDSSAFEALNDAGSRVRSMMLLYNKLYESVDYNNISVAEFLPSLLDQIAAIFPNSKSVTIVKHIENFVLNSQKLQPIGIIINELMTNMMKYAFAGRESGLITLSASKKGDAVIIIVEDDGIGIPESVDIDHSTGFGLNLVRMLMEQIDGTIRIVRNKGTKFILVFNL